LRQRIPDYDPKWGDYLRQQAGAKPQKGDL
jgi:hypothetical protein